MAFDAKEIGALRAAIPAEFQPSPRAAGRLAGYFSSVDSLRESTALQGSALTERDRHNLGMAIAADPEAATPGFRLTGAHASMRSLRLAVLAERKREEERRYVIQQIISQIDARNRQIEENLRRYAELERREAALEDHLARLRRGEKPALDADGRLRNRDAEAAIREYEQRYGVSVDRNDAAQIAVILGGIRDEQLRIVRENQNLAAENARDRQLALDMGADPASIPATVQSLRRTEEGKQSLDQATALLDSQALRREVVEERFGGTKNQEAAMDVVADPDAAFDEIAETGRAQSPKPPGP